MIRKTIPILLAGLATPALAQQSASNAVTQSEDAFGRATSNERIGIYSNDEVRGFNPSEAGNTRLEGLYVDQQQLTSPRLIDSLSIRVGYAARGTPFPAPTGIVDIGIEKFSGETRAGAELEWEDYSNVGGSAEAKVGLSGDKLGIALSYGFREADQVQFRNGSFRNYLAGISYLPAKGSEFILFTSGYKGHDSQFQPSFFPAGNAPPPQQPRKLQQSQPWALNKFGGTNSGLIAKTPLGANLKLEAGLFYTNRHEDDRKITLFLGTEPTGFVREAVVLAEQDNDIDAWSGEVRLTRTWTGTNVRHSLIAAVRGRDQTRIYAGRLRDAASGIPGGQLRISLGPSQAGVEDFRPEPVLVFGPKDRSVVRQFNFGLQYNLQTRSGSSLSLAVQKAQYRKSTDFADPVLANTEARDAPWLFSANGAWAIAPGLTVYGGYVRGLEESANAPDIAINRSEAPPARRTRQVDLGLRYALTGHLAVIGGVFEVKKPYFNLDASRRFGNLGTQSNRGIELSLAGTLAKGLTVVAGGILVDPRISGPEVDAGRIGRRPVGSSRQRGIFNLDWKPAGQQAWSFDLAFEAAGGEMANLANTFESPARSNLNLGARYRFAIGKSKVLIRAQVQNVFDSYAWRVNSAGGFTTLVPRIVSLHGFIDF